MQPIVRHDKFKLSLDPFVKCQELTHTSLIRMEFPSPFSGGIPVNKQGVEASADVKFDFLEEVSSANINPETPNSSPEDVSDAGET